MKAKTEAIINKHCIMPTAQEQCKKAVQEILSDLQTEIERELDSLSSTPPSDADTDEQRRISSFNAGLYTAKSKVKTIIKNNLWA